MLFFFVFIQYVQKFFSLIVFCTICTMRYPSVTSCFLSSVRQYAQKIFPKKWAFHTFIVTYAQKMPSFIVKYAQILKKYIVNNILYKNLKKSVKNGGIQIAQKQGYFLVKLYIFYLFILCNLHKNHIPLLYTFNKNLFCWTFLYNLGVFRLY